MLTLDEFKNFSKIYVKKLLYLKRTTTTTNIKTISEEAYYYDSIVPLVASVSVFQNLNVLNAQQH